MLDSNLQDSALATFLDFPGVPLTQDEQLFLKRILKKKKYDLKINLQSSKHKKIEKFEKFEKFEKIK